MQNASKPECEQTKDEILAARCESREPNSAAAQHLEHCGACREADAYLAEVKSPDVLAILVLMRGLS